MRFRLEFDTFVKYLLQEMPKHLPGVLHGSQAVYGYPAVLEYQERSPGILLLIHNSGSALYHGDTAIQFPGDLFDVQVLRHTGIGGDAFDR